jgi:chromosome segregation ATPase
MTQQEKPQRRLFTTLRDVLFESTPDTAPKVSGSDVSPAAATPPNVEAARAALEQSLGDHLGSALRELMLQISALEDVLPDPMQRKRAALRVLSLKGIGVPALVLELERVISALAAQHDAFSAKLAARREALGQQQNEAIESCRRQTAEAEQTIANLESALAAERSKLAQAAERRDQLLAEAEARATELAVKQQGFALAYAGVRDHYVVLKQELVALESH